jgi:hypothetical protein
MRCSGVGSSNTSPLRIIPEAGKLLENFFESEGEMPSNVFQDNVVWSKYANGFGDVWPDVS